MTGWGSLAREAIVSDWKFYVIALGFNDERLVYKDIDVSVFDMAGISNLNMQLRLEERKGVLKSLLPRPIFDDYNYFSSYDRMIKRLKRNRWIWCFIKLSYRFLKEWDHLRKKQPRGKPWGILQKVP